MAEIKTKQTDASVDEFIEAVDNKTRRQDAKTLLKIFREVTGQEPNMWGSSIVGYGVYHYKSERSSQEGDWPRTAFSPRKSAMTVYIMPGFYKLADELARLGKHKTSVSCLYINKLDDIDLAVLKRIIAFGYKEMNKQYPESPAV